MADQKIQAIIVQKEVGEAFSIERLDNPGSTGYTLSLTQLPEHIALINDHYEPSATGLAGAPGKRTFTFVGVAPTNGKIVLQSIKFTRQLTVEPPTFGDQILVQIFDPKKL